MATQCLPLQNWVDFNTCVLSRHDKPHNTEDADVQLRIANPKGIITSKETKIARYTKSQPNRAVFNAKENNTVE